MPAERELAARALAACALALLPTYTHAGEQSAAVGGLTVRVRDPWPERINHGAYPLFFDVQNPFDVARRVEVRVQCGFGGTRSEVEFTLDAPPGGGAAREVFVPSTSHGSNVFVELVAGADRGYLNGVGAAQPPDASVRTFVLASADRPAAGFVQQQQQALSDEAEPRRAAGANPGGFVIPAPAAPGVAPVYAQVEFVPFDDLPTRLESYTSLDAFVLDVSGGAPGDAALDAALAWGRLGGVVAIVGAGARGFVDGSRALAPWAQGRFLLSSSDEERAASSTGSPWELATTHERVHRFVFGQGTLVVGEAALDAAPMHAALNAAVEASRPWTPNVLGARGDGAAIGMDGLDPPYRALTALLLVFAIVVGPLNFWLVRRARRPALLLVTVPAIAIVFSLVIFGLGALAQGLDVRATSASFAVLDQRAHRSSSAESRLLFAGLSAGDGWRFGPGASCLGSAPERTFWDAQRNLRLTFDDGVVFGGDYLPVRTPSEQVFVVDRAARERVEFEREGGVVTAVNGLGTSIERLVLHDFDGSRWRAGAAIAPGAGARLEPVAAGDTTLEAPLVLALERMFAAEPAGAHARLPLGAYAAQIESSPFLDAGGVDYEERAHAHFLAGILESPGDAR